MPGPGRTPWIKEKLDRLPKRMDRHTPPARTPLWLLLPPLLLGCTLAEAASGVTVQVPQNVTGILNGSITLACNLTSADNVTVTQVTWTKNQDGSRNTVAVFHPTKGPSISDPERMKILGPKLDRDLWTISLAVSHLRVEDAGKHECQIATYPKGSGSATTDLRVIARPTTTAEALTPSPTWKLQAVAKCISTGGRPAPNISWHSDINGRVQEVPKLGPQPGTFTVISSFLLEPSSQADGKNVTCKVKHESLQQPDLRTVTLSVPYPPEVSITGYDDNWYVGRTNVSLTCNAHSKPKPTSYEWSTTKGPLPNTTEAHGNQLRIPIVDMVSMDNITFLCNVTNALGSGQNRINILVREPKQLNLGSHHSIIIPSICLSVIFLIGLCVILYKWGPKCWSKLKRSEREYSAVNTGNPTQGINMNSMRHQDQH